MIAARTRGPGTARALAALALAGALVTGCVEEVTAPGQRSPVPLRVGDERAIALGSMRFEVRAFEKRLTLADLRAMPRPVLEETWLLDLDVQPLVTNVLARFIATPPDAAEALPQASQNLWRVLQATPANAVLDGSELDVLLDLGAAVGFPSSKVLASLLGSDDDAPILPQATAAAAVVDLLVASHPNAQVRRGAVTADHPEGLYPVRPGAIPVSLADVVYDFDDLARRFGPAPPLRDGQPSHPGFVASASGIHATEPGFAMTVKVDLDALPYEAVDLTTASLAAVNSLRSQVEGMFDFDDEDWLVIEGLPDEVVMGELSMVLREADGFIPGGAAREPLPLGGSPAWGLPPWQLERVVVDAARRMAEAVAPHCDAWSPLGEVETGFEAVRVCIDETGWTEITVSPSVLLQGTPPAPAYLWDLLLEVTETRLHDGGLAEGAANPAITASNVPVGVTSAAVVAQVKANLRADPRGLTELAVLVNENSAGRPDLYHYLPRGDGAADHLYFVAPGDIPRGDDGRPVRPYGYAHPGFYADEALTKKVSSTMDVDGDTTHEKLRAPPGTVVFVEDDEGQVYRIEVGEKPSPHRILLIVRRTS